MEPSEIVAIRERVESVENDTFTMFVYGPYERLKDINTLLAEYDSLRTAWKARNILLLEVSGRGDMLKKEPVNHDALDGLVAVQNEFDRLRNIVIRNLQSELAASQKEVERFTRLYKKRSRRRGRAWATKATVETRKLASVRNEVIGEAIKITKDLYYGRDEMGINAAISKLESMKSKVETVVDKNQDQVEDRKNSLG